jgi:hypothetical protein
MSQPPKYGSGAERQAAYRRRRAQAEATSTRQTPIAPLPSISSVPGTIRWRQVLDHAIRIVAATRDEMQTYHDERTERWQESERAGDFLDRLTLIEQIAEQLEEVRGLI